jgi:hypothetical protein
MPNISLKIGHIEISYDGDQAYIEGGLLTLLGRLVEMPIAAVKQAGSSSAEAPTEAIGHTTSQIAQIISASTGPDLAIAAMAHLTLAKGQPKIQRADILAEMKEASSFYKENYSSNLSSILNGLVKKKQISPISANTFALPHNMKKEFEDKLKNE